MEINIEVITAERNSYAYQTSTEAAAARSAMM